MTTSASHQLARRTYSHPAVAAKYPAKYGDTRRDRREKACLLECMRLLPPGGHVLDLPCGTGRLTRLLLERGHRVTSADASEAMLARAEDNYRAYVSQLAAFAPVRFQLQDILATTFDADEFDGVMCIRMLHHFSDSTTRRRALLELRRVCRGPIIVSFLNSFALDRVAEWLKHGLRGRKQKHQLPIPFSTFAADIDATGLTIKQQIAAQWGISSRWFLVLGRHPSTR